MDIAWVRTPSYHYHHSSNLVTTMTRNKRHRSAKGFSVITHYVIRHHGQMSPTTIHSHTCCFNSLLFVGITMCYIHVVFFRKLKQYSTNFLGLGSKATLQIHPVNGWGMGWVANTSIMGEIRKVVFDRLPHTPWA